MRSARLHQFRLLTFLAITLLTVACATGPAPPQKGTPAFYWQAATESFAVGDYPRTSDHLEQLTESTSEFTARAQPWRLVVTGGLATGFKELADHYELGGQSNKTNPTPFRVQTGEYRTRANRQALQFAETFLAFEQAHKDPKVELAFGFPRGSVLPIAELTKVGAGILPQPAEQASAEKRALERGVLMITCSVVGTPENTTKAQDVFRATPVQIPKETFLVAMASTLYDLSQIYLPRKLDQPERLQLFCEKALAAVKAVPETKETKDLASKIESELKKKRR